MSMELSESYPKGITAKYFGSPFAETLYLFADARGGFDQVMEKAVGKPTVDITEMLAENIPNAEIVENVVQAAMGKNYPISAKNIIEIPINVFCRCVEDYVFMPHAEKTEGQDATSTIESGIEQRYLVDGVEMRDLRIPQFMAKISTDDYYMLVLYVFTNSDLTENDPRISLVNRCIFDEITPGNSEGQRKVFELLANFETVPGWNASFHPESGAKRLAFPAKRD
jgi:hypothetical protein